MSEVSNEETPKPIDNNYNKVSSELYEERNYISNLPPFLDNNNVVSRFDFTCPPRSPQLDPDGDLEVSRKRTYSILIEHSRSTELDLVGLQVWRGALLLADWLLCNGPSIDPDRTILELGAGVGLTSVVAAMFAPVITTDVDRCGILDLIRSNVRRNCELYKCPIKVVGLDFMNETIPSDVADVLGDVSVIIAADVIYDDLITLNFVRTVERLLAFKPCNSDRCVYVALEKRYVFTIADCDSVAPCFEFFMDCIRDSDCISYEFLSIDFPQYFVYDRVKELTLLKLSYKK